MRIVEVERFREMRHAVITLRRRRDGNMRVVLVPMAHVAHPEFYRQVTRQLEGCDVILTEGIGKGGPRWVRLITIAYELMPYVHRSVILQPRNVDLLPPGARQIWADVSGREIASDLRAGLGRRGLAYYLVLGAAVGLVGAVVGPSLFIIRGVNAVLPARIPPYGYHTPRERTRNSDPASIDIRRNRRLFAELDRLDDAHRGEELTVGVVYGANHIAEVFLHLFVRRGYRLAAEPVWLTPISVHGSAASRLLSFLLRRLRRQGSQRNRGPANAVRSPGPISSADPSQAEG